MEAAFLQLVQQHAGILHKVCNLYCTHPGDRQDLLQEMMLQLWKSFPAFRNEAKLSTWIYRVVLNTAITAFRKEEKRPATQALTEETILYDREDDASLYNEQWKMIQGAIGDLTDIEKAIIILYLENRTYMEMEDILGISQATLRVKMNRIKEKLRKKVNAQTF
ncbi:MAG: RNA polymerase sigma factor [Chitinophagaceae bacterium]|nr:RNA polymerase sigma factor [Chitinophagaceae bacterium]MCW5929770.1 RNA polymerase sigma factor [Chitinophagaceae bacterium]